MQADMTHLWLQAVDLAYEFEQQHDESGTERSYTQSVP